ncbi:hypothetical protein HY413_03650 [Candidatus Kaiserbacteria bacterium]|nr:hypothetical protein [Candidatus Kaiserbacteria bacterium]
MKKLLLSVIILTAVGGGLYYYGDAILPDPLKESINDRIDGALLTATIDATEFGGGIVTLVNGEAVFSVGGIQNGFVTLGAPRAVVVKGDDADVFVLVNINGGGSGTFQFLTHFAYSGSEGTAHEVEKIMLGDRTAVKDIKAEITAPTQYAVFVSILERKTNEPMSTTPTQPQVLNVERVAEKFVLKAVIFNSIENPDVVLLTPLPNQKVANTFLVQGAARGPWYFEASFPVTLVADDGIILDQTPAQAQSDWMTTELVPFMATLVAPSTYHGPATLVIKNDNPSGDPARDKMVEIPVTIK